MDYHEYKNIEPTNHKLLKNNWTNELQDQIWAKTDIQCTFSFKSNYVPSNLKLNKIKCDGKCTQCGANILVTIDPTTSNFIDVSCLISQYKKDFVHDSTIKNKLNSVRKQKLAVMLKHNRALAVRAMMADKIIGINEPSEPPTFPKLSTLRRIRHEVKSALQFDKNPILSIYAMSQSPPFDSFIQKFSLIPFFLYFWTQEQGKYYDEVLKNTHIVLSIDATGSIFQVIAPPNVNDNLGTKEPKHTFLYAVVAYTANTSIPLCYMASQSHTTETIATWLSTWARNRNTPNEIISDDSSALLGAICRSFLNTDTNIYLAQCFSILEGEHNSIPACYIRLDKSHFFKKLYKQSCFEKATEKCKNFYINCIKKIHLLKSYDEVKSVIKDIVTVSLREHVTLDLDGQSCKKYDQAVACLANISEYKVDIQHLDNCNDDESLSYVLHDEKNNSNNVGTNPLIQYYDNVLETEKLYLMLIDPNEHKNEYYLPEINDTLKRLLKKLPMWSGVMDKYFRNVRNVGSSSNVENHFKDLKTIYFNTKQERIRLDEFLIQHYTYINGMIKLNKAKYSETATKINKNEHMILNQVKQTKIIGDFEEQSIFQDYPVEIENWRGLVIPNKKSISSKPLYILQNGNVSISKDIKTVVTNTCAFDAVAQAFAVAYTDRISFRHFIDPLISKDSFTRFFIQLSNTKKNCKTLYAKRDILLNSLFNVNDNTLDARQCQIIDCACNVTKIIEDVCLLYFSGNRKKCCSNKECLFSLRRCE